MYLLVLAYLVVLSRDAHTSLLKKAHCLVERNINTRSLISKIVIVFD